MRKRSKIAALLLVVCLLMGCNDAPALAAVPDVTEARTDVAVALLTQQGFVPVVKEIADPTADVGTVLRTDPPAGSYVAIGEKVYLWVAAHADTGTSLSTTSALHTSTTAASASTSPSATHSSTSLRPTTTTANPTTTTALCAAGHLFVDGICSVCHQPDPDYVQTLSIGQTWTVKRQWSLTLLSVTAHYPCNPFHDDSTGSTDKQAVILRYSYENIGFADRFDDLLINNMAFTLTQDNGTMVTAYACYHTQVAVPCAVGESCIAEEAYLLDASCRRVTLRIAFRTSNGNGTRCIQFDIPLP